MKKIILFFFLGVLLPGTMVLGFDRGGGGGGFGGRDGGDGGWDHGGGNGGEGSAENSRSVRNWSRMGITHASRGFSDHSHVLNASREHSFATLPSRGPGGEPFKASMMSPRNMNSSMVRSHMASITGSSAFKDEIGRYNASERVVGKYNWHSFNGVNYVHYYDRWGGHWYGWWLGGGFFWTQYYWGSWWWYDPYWFRWCYWDGGWWWWQDPYDSVVYAYDNGRYVPDGPYGSPAGGVVEFRSNDGTRTVKMVGQDAFLFDTSGSNTFKPVFLERGVVQVWFSKPSGGKPPRIRAELNDGTFEFFDEQGKLMESPAKENSTMDQ